jgi:hypothetical protein
VQQVAIGSSDRDQRGQLSGLNTRAAIQQGNAQQGVAAGATGASLISGTGGLNPAALTVPRNAPITAAGKAAAPSPKASPKVAAAAKSPAPKTAPVAVKAQLPPQGAVLPAGVAAPKTAAAGGRRLHM